VRCVLNFFKEETVMGRPRQIAAALTKARSETEASRAARHALQIHRCGGEWLSDYEWSYYITGTFKTERSSLSADVCVRKYLRSLGRTQGKQLPYISAVEAGRYGLRFHAHVLLYTPLPNRVVRDKWIWGKSDVKKYSSFLRATDYFSKVFTDQDAIVRLSRVRWMRTVTQPAA
jgi:hypothetical protein